MAKVIDRVMSALTAFNQRMTTQAASSALPPRELYNLLDAYYQNNGLYDYLAEAMYTQSIWKEALKSLRNPAYRVVEFYVGHLWPGALPQALPIETNNKRIMEPIKQVWGWSNWGANKQLASRWLAKYGDIFIKVAQPEDKSQVFFQLIEPQYVVEFEKDNRGFITYIRVDTPQSKRVDGVKKGYIYTEVWDKAAGLFRAWEHDKGLDAALDRLGPPSAQRILAKATLGQAGDDYVGVDFVPFVHAKFMDVGEARGVGAFTLALDKIDEANRKATRLAQMIFRYNKPLFALRANAMDANGRPLPAPRIGGGAAGEDGDTIALGDDRLLRLPGQSDLTGLVPNVDYDAHLKALAADMEELEADLPELTYYRISRTGGAPSGLALQLLLAPAVAKAVEARGNAETALARADTMALTMGANAGLFKNIGAFEAGDFEHSFKERDVLPLPVIEKLQEGQAYVTMGVPVRTALVWIGKNTADLKRFDDDQTAAQEQQKQTLAAAVLNAQKQLDAGQADNGLTRPPSPQNTDDITP